MTTQLIPDQTATKSLTFAAACNEALAEALELDDSVFLLGEDIADEQGGGVFKVTTGLSSRFGTSRVRSTPISEQAIMGAAIGAALAGMRPVAEIMLMNFLTVAMDQLFNHAAKLRYMSGGQTGVPLTVITTTGAGAQFGAQHSDMLEAWLAHAAGLRVVVPSNPSDAKGLLLSCIFDDDPCVFVENSLLLQASGPVPVSAAPIPLGRANVVREGDDVTVIAYGRPMHDVNAVAEGLAGEGIGVEVIDLRSIAPLDFDTVLTSVAKTTRAVVVHEAVQAFGVGAEVAARITEELWGELQGPVRRVGALQVPVPYAAGLEAAYLPGRADIEQAIRSVVS
jgi:pyruvate dehydrogenase E1 component beta subunit